MIKKKTIRLTENDLHRVIKESVRKILRENSYGHMGRRINEVSDDLAMRAAKKAFDKHGYFNDYQDLPSNELAYGRRKREQAYNLIDNALDRIRTNDYDVDKNNKYVKNLYEFYD